MSLDYDYSQVKNADEMLKEKKGEAVLNALVYSLGLEIGISDITRKNWKEVFIRIEIRQKVRGCWFFQYNEKMERIPYYLTKEDVKNWIGLATNGCIFSWAEFCKRLHSRMEEDLRKD